MKIYFQIFVITLLSTFSVLNAQTRHYDIVLFGEIIGEITSQQKNISENEYELSYTSKAEAEVFFTQTKTFVQAKFHYKNGSLESGHLIRKKNNDIQEIECQWKDNQYYITENGEKTIHKEKISYCTTNFFFKEPVNIHTVYVERLLKFVDVQHLGDHQYLTKVEGGSNLYTYKNGVLQSLKSKKGISIYMNLRE